MSIVENYNEVKRRVAEAARRSGRDPEDVLLLAVTKLHSPEEMNEVISAGATDIGENKVQEIMDKYDDVDPAKWHLIGHLQTNKVKYIIDKVVLIHSVDSMHLAKEIDKRAEAAGKTMDVLVQVSPVGEDTKFGVAPEDTAELVSAIKTECPRVKVKGLMCIAPFSEDPEDARPSFRLVKGLFDEIGKGDPDFQYLSMGMTNDFEVAIEEGANIVRVGTAIFGARDYRSEEK